MATPPTNRLSRCCWSTSSTTSTFPRPTCCSSTPSPRRGRSPPSLKGPATRASPSSTPTTTSAAGAATSPAWFAIASARGGKGRAIVRLLKPDPDDYLVLKPKHSAFFHTTLDLLLAYLGVETVVLAGFAGNICVLFTANDLYLRDVSLVVPSDCCASNEQSENEHALRQMRTILKADTRPSSEVDWRRLLGERPKPPHRPRLVKGR